MTSDDAFAEFIHPEKRSFHENAGVARGLIYSKTVGIYTVEATETDHWYVLKVNGEIVNQTINIDFTVPPSFNVAINTAVNIIDRVLTV